MRPLLTALAAASAILGFAGAAALRTRDAHGRPVVLTQDMPRAAVPKIDGVWSLTMGPDSMTSSAAGASHATVVIDPRIAPNAGIVPATGPIQFGEMTRVDREGGPVYEVSVAAVLAVGDTVVVRDPYIHGCGWRFAVRGDAGTGRFSCVGGSRIDGGTVRARRRNDPAAVDRAIGRSWAEVRRMEGEFGDMGWDRLGWIRVRILDRRTGRPLAGTVGAPTYPLLRAGPTGFGPFWAAPEGTLKLRLAMFACGGRMMYVSPFADGVPAIEAKVRRLLPVQATLEIDPSRIPTAPSAENPRG